jgi:hypothetical protein
MSSFYGPSKSDPISAAYWLCPTIDTDLCVDDGKGKHGIIVHASDWLEIPGPKLLERTTTGYLGNINFNSWGANVRPICRGGHIVGRACIVPSSIANGCVTIGGFRCQTVLSIAGVMQGESVRVARDEAEVCVPHEELARWATEQAALVPSTTKDKEQLATCARIVALLGGDIGDLPIAKVAGGWVGREAFSEWARDKESVIVITVSVAAKIERRSYGWPFRENVAIEPSITEEWITLPLHRRLEGGAFSILEDLLSELKGESDSEHVTRRNRKVTRPILKAVASAWSVAAEDLEVWTGDGFDISDDAGEVDAEEIKRPNADD